MSETPLLGLATTREMLEELKARGELLRISGEPGSSRFGEGMASEAHAMLRHLPNRVLDYQTASEQSFIDIESQKIHLWGYQSTTDRWVFGVWMPGSDTPIDEKAWVAGEVTRAIPYNQRPANIRDVPRRAFAPDAPNVVVERERKLSQLRQNAAQAEAELSDFTNEVLQNAPDYWDDDAAAQAIAVRYVRWLEEKTMKAYGSLEPREEDHEGQGEPGRTG